MFSRKIGKKGHAFQVVNEKSTLGLGFLCTKILFNINAFFYFTSGNVVFLYIFIGLKCFQVRAYPNICCRAWSENSTDKGHLPKVSEKCSFEICNFLVYFCLCL